MAEKHGVYTLSDHTAKLYIDGELDGHYATRADAMIRAERLIREGRLREESGEVPEQKEVQA